jgi:hypothetical protein
MKIDQLIQQLEFGINRTESPDWIVFSLTLKDGAEELLDDLKDVLDKARMLEDTILDLDHP